MSRAGVRAVAEHDGPRPTPCFIHISDGRLHDAHVLVAILRMRLTLSHSLHAMLQAHSGMPFEKIPLNQLF